MSKHGPIMPDPEGDPRPKRVRGPSLVERAANVYDFGRSVRGTRPEPDAAPIPAVPPPLNAIDPAWAAPRPAARYGVIAADRLRAEGFALPGAAPNALAEEFRIVKRQLLATAGAVANGHSILICSARPGEGKTFCAINLALSLAREKDMDVVLVDADVAKPGILATLGLEDGPGLLDALADPLVDVAGCLIRTDVEHLSVLPAGRRTDDATELLASARTRNVLERLRGSEGTRVLLFDSPPALAASPASALAMHCGQAVVVVRAERTSERDLRETLDLLAACAKPQLLLNGVEYGGADRRFGRSYGYEAAE